MTSSVSFTATESECDDPDCFLFHVALFDSFGLEAGLCAFDTEYHREQFVLFVNANCHPIGRA